MVNDSDKDLARKWRDDLNLGRGRDQIFFHAEGHALMRAYDITGGKLPSKLTIYVDRISCGNCQTYLPRLTKSMRIDELTMVFKDGRTAIIKDGKFIGSWK